MSILRIKELEQQLKRRDDRILDLENKLESIEDFLSDCVQNDIVLDYSEVFMMFNRTNK